MNLIMNDFKPGNEEPIDTLLGRYFRSEMPHPWPECEAIAQARSTPRPSRFRAVGRLALAASIVLFFVGYFALAGLFPPSSQGPSSAGSSAIGKSPMKIGTK